MISKDKIPKSFSSQDIKSMLQKYVAPTKETISQFHTHEKSNFLKSMLNMTNTSFLGKTFMTVSNSVISHEDLLYDSAVCSEQILEINKGVAKEISYWLRYKELENKMNYEKIMNAQKTKMDFFKYKTRNISKYMCIFLFVLFKK